MEQDPADEPAFSALKRINATGSADGKFPLPTSWAWIEVGAVAKTRLGKMLDKAKNKGTPRPYLRNINVRWFDFDLSDLLEMPFEDSELDEFSLRLGDVLICEGGEPGRAAVWDARADGIYFQKAIHRVRFAELVHPHFFLLSLKTSAEDGRLAGSFTGTGIKHFTGKGLSSHRFPLPPLAEQRRIVAKVEELMNLCGRLEAACIAREATRDRLTAASLARLTAPDTDAETYPTHARFALDVLPALTTRPDQIKPLRQTILNLAVRGKLVEQDPADEPAPELLKRIAADRKQRAVSARDRRAGAMEPLKEADAPFDLPPSWLWVAFGDVTISRDGERVPVSRAEREGREKIYDYYGASGVIDKIDGYLFDKQLLLIGEDGANLINRSTPIAFIARGKYWVNNHAHVLDGLNEEYLRYLELFINATDLKPFVTGTAQPKMNQAKMNSIPIALPPLAEQHRIVAKFDALMALCNRLEAALQTTDTTRARLLAAVLHDALAPAAEALEAAQ